MGTQATSEMSYGALPQTISETDVEKYIEELNILGYTVIENVLDSTELKAFETKVLQLYDKVEAEYGKEYLQGIKEANVVRTPLQYDDLFLELPKKQIIRDIATAALGENYSLHLQNAIINKAENIHHQRSWHRDLPYQNYVISKPISLNAMFCIHDFNTETGGTELIPYSHNLEAMPSTEYCAKHTVMSCAKAGSVVLFNSMLIHRAGVNNSGNIRIGVNHVFTVPIIKQQIDLPRLLEGKHRDDSFLNSLLGYRFQVPESDKAFKDRMYKKANG